MTDDQREAFEERAAILQFEAGMSKREAEMVAARQMLLTPEDMIEFEMGQDRKPSTDSAAITKGRK